MPRVTQAEREKLLVRKAQIEARLQALEVSERKQTRKDDARRKIIYGALAMEHAATDPDLAATMNKLLNRYVTRPGDRKLFDLPEREKDMAKEATEDVPSDQVQAQAESA